MLHGPPQRNIHEKRAETEHRGLLLCWWDTSTKKFTTVEGGQHRILLGRKYSPVSETNLLVVPAPKPSTNHHKIVVIGVEGVREEGGGSQLKSF